MPPNPIIVVEVFDVWVLTLCDHFHLPLGMSTFC